jgi:thiol-disulfide isomerase/thioredoxin
VGYVCIAACCLALMSCGTFGKKSPIKPKEPPLQSANTGWPPPPETPATPLAQPAPSTGVGGLLAGRVLDSYDRPPPATYIRVVSAGDNADPKNAPLEVATDSQGYFTIHGVQAGQHYQLIARTRDGDPKLAGTTWATPPNARILIYMSQDFATPNTPPAPAPPAAPGQKPPAPAAPPSKHSQSPGDAKEGTVGSSAGEPNRDPVKSSSSNGPAAGATIGPPMKLNEAAPLPVAPRSAVPPQPRSEIRTQDIVSTPDVGVRVPPVANIPPQADPGRRPAVDSPGTAVPPPPPPRGPATQVPSCVLIGKQLRNFALYGLNAQPWEYRQHHGRVVLLVFWETACLPCRAAIPHLKSFQNRYGPNGLEIIAIAYEEGTLQEQIRKLRTVNDRLEMNYRLLLGGDVGSCPVGNQFGVNAFPTLVLLDEHNSIVWRQQGLDAYKLQELELQIKFQLRAR